MSREKEGICAMTDPNSIDAQLPVFQTLSSDLRLEIMKYILRQGGVNLKQIAKQMGLSMSTLSPHIAKLEKCGLIRIADVPASHGIQKCCYPNTEQIVIDFTRGGPGHSRVYQAEVPVGSYSDFEVTPTCGLATESAFLGRLDEPRQFAHPDRRKALILWFTTGYVEYLLPNFIPRNNVIDSLSLTFEISSEAPRYNNNWPSDIEFSLNGTLLGRWTCPGDFGGRPGTFNPGWWYDFLNQYGLLKKLTVDRTGCYLDGDRLSDITVRDLALDDQSVLKLRFSVPPGMPNSKGLTLYGQGFGDYNQDIRMMIEYSPKGSGTE